MSAADIYVGIMSGTSLDGIDVSICRFDEPRIDLLLHHTFEWPAAIRSQLLSLVSAEDFSVDELTRLNFALSRVYADAVQSALKSAGLQPSDIHAIGLHGQTIRHLPADGATWQLGSGPALAVITGIDVVHDFRSADVALGGQGAPLVPMFDYIFLRSADRDRVVTNIGGITNVTFIPKSGETNGVFAYDTGPGNMIIDTIAREYLGKSFDEDGKVASRGIIDHTLLTSLLDHPYFQLSPPKSTGRELIERDFTPHFIRSIESGLSREDALATAVELTAISLAHAAADSNLDLILSGGGAKNGFLVSRIRAHLPAGADVKLSAEVGIDEQAKESIAFAYFAKAFVERKMIHLPNTTGASRGVMLGSLARGH